jgi:DNA polymerase-3 subunit delta'
MAYRLARFILKNSAEANTSGSMFGEEDLQDSQTLAIPANDPVHSKVASSGHPDLFVVQRPFDDKKGQLKKDIPVEEIRKIAPFLRRTSSDGGWRIVIVDDANLMNRSGQNALLKILEEPPKKALLILVSHGAGGLLPTIRSRCRFMPFNALEENEIATILSYETQSHVNNVNVKLLTMLADGSVGKAMSLYRSGDIQMIKDLLSQLQTLNTLNADELSTLGLTYAQSGGQDGLNSFIFIVERWLELLIYITVEERGSIIIGDMTLSSDLDLHALLSLKDAVHDHITMCLQGTLDKRYLVHKTLTLIQKAFA